MRAPVSLRALPVIVVLVLSCLAPARAPAATAEDGRPAEPLGLETAPPSPPAKPGLSEDGVPYGPPIREDRTDWLLGKVEPAVLAAWSDSADLDLLVFVRTVPRGVFPLDVRQEHLPAIEELGRQIRDIDRRYRPAWSLDEEEERSVTALVPTVMSEEDRGTRRALQLELDNRLSAMRAAVRRAAVLRIGPERDQVIAAVEALGGKVRAVILPTNSLHVTLPGASLPALAEHPLVTMVLLHELDRLALNVSVPSAGFEAWTNDPSVIDGGAFDAGVADSGVQEDHPAFAGINFYSDDPSPTDTDGHGTHVAGIIASNDLTYRGTAYGLDKLMWERISLGREESWEAVMDQSGTTDTPEVLNYSAGGALASDADYVNRDAFADAYVLFYNVQVAIAAGNEYWSDTLPTILHPSNAYNLITVANMNDQGTLDRSDDVRRGSSSVGPTLGGRAKPDISAPGTTIRSTNAFWAGAGSGPNYDCRVSTVHWDFVDCTGTSMAAPHVAGAVVLMEDGGNSNPEAQKVVLINTADWWDSNDTSATDDDGPVLATSGYGSNDWDKSYGWGYLDMDEAYFNRGDYFAGSLVPRNDNATEDDYKLYAGYMYAHEKATLTWNKRAEYLAGVEPTTVYGLSDINLRLYNETSGGLSDIETESNENTHQVAASTSMNAVIKVYAWSTTFDGASTEAFALATEEGFALVDFPETFQGIGAWPSVLQPNEEGDVEFWIRNDSTLASHVNQFELVLPTGWTLVSGTNPVGLGSVAGGGGYSTHAVWRVRAPATTGPVSLISRHTHSSYDESYGPHNWGMGIDVVQDVTPPTPNPMTWSLIPYELNTSQIQMVATTATDEHGPVEYYHDYTGSPSGGTGGSDSGWIGSTTFTDSGLQANQEYCYRIWARDNPITTPNNTSPSANSCDCTDIETPTGITFGTITPSSIAARSTSTPSNLTWGVSGLLVQNLTTGDHSGWKQNNDPWTSGALSPNTPYQFRAEAKNCDGSITPWSGTGTRFTLANPPGPIPPSKLTETSLRASWTANGNPAGTEYLAENLTSGANSGWITATFWDSTGLVCGNSYTFRVRARNGDLVQTSLVALGSEIVGNDADGDLLADCVDPDDDNDGAKDTVDCLPFDPVAWSVPSEVQGLSATHSGGTTTLRWGTPGLPGAAETLYYDTAMSTLSDVWNAAPASCLEVDDTDHGATHGTDPHPGQVLFFLARAQNRCGNGDEGTGEDVPAGLPIPRNLMNCGCAHAICHPGGPLNPGCDPCAQSVCAVDPYCCTTAWDSICIGEVTSVCGLTCP